MRAISSGFRYSWLSIFGLLLACQRTPATPAPDASLLVGLWSGQQETRTVYDSKGQVTATNTVVFPSAFYAHYLRFTPTTVMDSSVNLIITSVVARHPYPYTVQGNTFTTPADPPGTTTYTTTYTIKALTAHALQLQSSTSAGNTLERIALEVSYVK